MNLFVPTILTAYGGGTKPQIICLHKITNLGKVPAMKTLTAATGLLAAMFMATSGMAAAAENANVPDTKAGWCVIDAAEKKAVTVFRERKKSNPSGYDRTYVIEGAELEDIKNTCNGGRRDALGNYRELYRLTMMMAKAPRR